MGEIKQANFRIDSDTADAFRAFCEQKGMNQAQGFDHVMQVFELNQAKSSIPGRSVEIEEFETMVKSITSAYLYSLELNQNAEARAREEFSSELQRKELRLTELQKKVEQLQAEMKKRLLNNEGFVMLYLDLDNFKAYNDVYGFLKGDEIIEFTAETICKCLHSAYNENVFIGHIGGDDFVGIIPDLHCDKVCQQILATFDAKSLKFFTQEDREKGYIEVANRKGIIEQFPLTSLSIGVVVADVGRFHNILEIGEVGAQVKHAAKSVMGSSYAIDRRKEG